MSALAARIGRTIQRVERTGPGASHEELLERIRACLPEGDPRFAVRDVPLDGELSRKATAYFRRFATDYPQTGAEREKALEHALTFELLDFARVARYCDVASDSSPVVRACADLYGDVQVFRQDLSYQTDLEQRQIGGPAEQMRDVAAGYFDALSLHCSYEHFAGDADSDFVAEVDRVLGSNGACLILPLYVASAPRVHFDPTRVSASTLARYDRDAELCATWSYRETHGRYYSPETLWRRVLSRVPAGLNATLLSFRNQDAVHASVYLRFGLLLHRPRSIVR